MGGVKWMPENFLSFFALPFPESGFLLPPEMPPSYRQMSSCSSEPERFTLKHSFICLTLPHVYMILYRFAPLLSSSPSSLPMSPSFLPISIVFSSWLHYEQAFWEFSFSHKAIFLPGIVQQQTLSCEGAMNLKDIPARAPLPTCRREKTCRVTAVPQRQPPLR